MAEGPLLPGSGGPEPSAATPGSARTARVRRRLIAVAILVTAVGASGAALDHLVGPRAAAGGTPEAAATGAWFCPHGGSPGWSGWIVVTNPGSAQVKVRLTQLTDRRVRAVSEFAVPPLRQVYREVSASDPADATAVEYFGGWVGVGAIIRSSSPTGTAAERCEPAARRTWYVLDEPTGPGDTTFLVVMNPFAQDASFDVVVRTELRTIAPGALRPYVLPAHSSVAFRLNDIALEGPGESTVTVEVDQRIGRVVAGGLVQTPDGIRAEAGSDTPSKSSAIPAGGYAGAAQLILYNPGQDRAEVTVVSSGRTGQKLASGPNQISLAPGEVKTVPMEGLPGAAVLVQSDNGQSIISALRLTGAGGDEATVSGVAVPSRAWLALPALSPSGGRSILVLQNPGRTSDRIDVQLIGANGTVPAPRLRAVLIPPGRTISLVLPGGGKPVSALVRATRGTVVVGTAANPGGGAAYAASLGVQIRA